ncbi:MAG: 23S rRNA (guanosine(2251)-2'-O)-methyltransferase RlmB [Blastocatellia bacterium]|nr:23S rRNA (guanosine(2251)-2'-O)-methyltransferase RlmB [Blastocatellia bacterium]
MPNVYGVLPVLEALRAGDRPIERIVIAEGARHERLREIIASARRAGVPIRKEPRASLDRLTDNANHQGVVAVAAAVVYADESKLLEDISAETIFLLLDGVEDPRNLGAIIRTAECAGASAVIIPERRAAHLTDVVAKTSAGAIEHLPIARVTNLASFIERLKERNVWVVGVESSGEMSYTEYDYSGPLALVLGGEGRGLHRLVRERCDLIVSIPMRGRITSLNVSVAAGIVLFEAVRQRRERQGGKGAGEQRSKEAEVQRSRGAKEQ